MYTDTLSIPYFEQTITDPYHIYFPKVLKKDAKYSIARGKNSYSVLPLYCGFDIETTNVPELGAAFMYIASFSIATLHEHIIYHFRYWDHFIMFLDALGEHYKLDAKHRMMVGVANMGFEFQFLRKRVQWLDDDFGFFAKEHRKPLLATTSNYIEFREVLSITGGGLAYLAEHYTKTKKAVGDLDYNGIQRNGKTVLTPTEYGYINADVAILSEFMYYILENYTSRGHRYPLTRTSILHQSLIEKLKKECLDFRAYQAYIKSLFPGFNDYVLYFNYLFRGGYVHANIYHVAEMLHGIISFDETSAYPAMMLLKDNYPVTPFKETECIFETWFEYCLQNYACVIDVTFTGIERCTNHSIESSSKCLELIDAELDNGRVKSAKTMRVLLTELDFANYKDFYNWQTITINSLKIAKRGKLPKPLLDLLKDDYKYKNMLKKTGKKDSQEYEIYKNRVNSWYGDLCKRVPLDNWKYTDDWHNFEKSSIDYDKLISNMVLSPFWGFYVSANARRCLLFVVRQMESAEYENPENRAYITEQGFNNSVAYNDTDSIKCIDDPAMHRIIAEYNASIQARKREINLLDDDFETLGCFEFEEKYNTFKTLGAKRYMVEKENGQIVATIAGFPKSAIKNIDDPFNKFSVHGMDLTPEQSTKHTAIYNDETVECVIDGERMIEYSSVCIIDIPFKMGLKDFYFKILDQFERKGKKL